MEEVQKKLAMLNNPRANAPAQSLIFAGMEIYALLEWLFFRVLGDRSLFSQQNLQGDATDGEEETGGIQYLVEIAKFLGITTCVDTEAIQFGTIKRVFSDIFVLLVDSFFWVTERIKLDGEVPILTYIVLLHDMTTEPPAVKSIRRLGP